MKENDLLHIEWLDHCSFTDSNWKSRDELETLAPVRVVTVGFLVKDHKDFFIVASTVGDNGQYVGDFCIAKGTIVKVKKIRIP